MLWNVFVYLFYRSSRIGARVLAGNHIQRWRAFGAEVAWLRVVSFYPCVASDVSFTAVNRPDALGEITAFSEAHKTNTANLRIGCLGEGTMNSPWRRQLDLNRGV